MNQTSFINLMNNYYLPDNRAEELLNSFSENIKQNTKFATQYLPVEGLPEHLDLIANWLSNPSYQVKPEQVSIGVSGHQFLMAILLGLTQASDQIACDPITYNGWLNITRHVSRKNIAVPGDHYGMIPEALDEIASKTKLWGIFLMPSLHNPCATVMPLERRKAIVEVCQRHNLWIIDDDAYRFLNPDPPPSFAHLYPERTFWLQSLTKPLFPSIKTAFLVSPSTVTPVLREVLRITAHQPSSLTLPWVLKIISTGELDKLTEEKRIEACRRQGVATDILKGLKFKGIPSSFHLWIDLPDGWSSVNAQEALKLNHVGVVQGLNYAVEGQIPPNSIRVALVGDPDFNRVLIGLRTIAQVLLKL